MIIMLCQVLRNLSLTSPYDLIHSHPLEMGDQSLFTVYEILNGVKLGSCLSKHLQHQELFTKLSILPSRIG